jgi:hypothetical protein
MNVMHLTVSFEHQSDTTRSARDSARREALALLENARSVFGTMTASQVASFATSNSPVTAGIYDIEDTTHEPIEDQKR